MNQIIKQEISQYLNSKKNNQTKIILVIKGKVFTTLKQIRVIDVANEIAKHLKYL
jgi:hypothetical protein